MLIQQRARTNNVVPPLQAPAPSFLLECFEALAWSRAYRWASFEIDDLHEAVDFLQMWAEQMDLVDHFGQDAIQQIISSEFGKRRLHD